MKTSFNKMLTAGAVAAALSLSQQAAALTIALSNDDGYDAIGIQALKQALIDDGHTVILVAPADGQSASSAALNYPDNVYVTKTNTIDDSMEFKVSIDEAGTLGAEPATSALMALSIATDPDLLITGINSGSNVGSFTQISGTVGAATMGLNSTLNQQIPAIAVSSDDPACDEDTTDCAEVNQGHYATVASFIAGFVAHLETKPGFLSREEGLLPVGVGLNINYPPIANPKGVVIAAQGQTAEFTSRISGPDHISLGCHGDCASADIGEPIEAGITGAGPNPLVDVKNSDTSYYLDGYITIVPFEVDYTAKGYRKFKSVMQGFNY